MCAHLRSDPCTSFRAVDGISPVDLCKSFNSGGARRILLSGKKARVFVIYLSSLDLPPHNIIHSAIGLPPCSVLINTSSSEDEDHEVTPHLLITTQTKLKPSRSPLPTIKQTIIKPILKSTSNQPCEDLNDDDQELFITGISDLDHVFDVLLNLSMIMIMISNNLLNL
ncbi:hypothetical protein PSHT_15411 [Puccinia striiformis]|uniref:Uncharacterized protein n=1 Tax=Puccinia striiformis TaxID=27350 RepID=A0A2S4UF27_9BASI|nr:hypothetical protein PSHT_15411 [Puccinia striiformis]